MSWTRLPHNKKCIGKIKLPKTQKSLTLTQLQSLIGLLNFARNVVLPGRTFFKRLIDPTIGKSNPLFLNKHDRRCEEDLNVWGMFSS